jgi:hypothetical protein
MRIPVLTHTEEVAGGRRATSAQPRRATAALLPRLSASQTPRPNPRVFATTTNGASQEGLLFAPLSTRSQKRKSLIGKPSLEPRISR